MGSLSRNAGDAIADVLAERVLSGEYAADDRLPSERQLAVEFGASRPMVREALRSLVERGLSRGPCVLRTGTGLLLYRVVGEPVPGCFAAVVCPGSARDTRHGWGR